MTLPGSARSWRPLTLPLVLLTLASACSPAAPERSAAPAVASATAAAGAATADNGPHTVTGTLPAAIGGFPSILILEAQGASGEAAPSPALAMDQVQQTFIPPVLMVRTGQPVEFRNSDEVLHNVRVREDATHSPAFNVAIPTGEKYTFTFPRDGFYDVGCDIHPGMAAQIVATQTPYTAVAAADGAYEIAGVPSGPYKAIVYTGAEKIEKVLSIDASQTRFDVGSGGSSLQR